MLNGITLFEDKEHMGAMALRFGRKQLNAADNLQSCRTRRRLVP